MAFWKNLTQKFRSKGDIVHITKDGKEITAHRPTAEELSYHIDDSESNPSETELLTEADKVNSVLSEDVDEAEKQPAEINIYTENHPKGPSVKVQTGNEYFDKPQMQEEADTNEPEMLRLVREAIVKLKAIEGHGEIKTIEKITNELESNLCELAKKGHNPKEFYKYESAYSLAADIHKHCEFYDLHKFKPVFQAVLVAGHLYSDWLDRNKNPNAFEEFLNEKGFALEIDTKNIPKTNFINPEQGEICLVLKANTLSNEKSGDRRKRTENAWNEIGNYGNKELANGTIRPIGCNPQTGEIRFRATGEYKELIEKKLAERTEQISL